MKARTLAMMTAALLMLAENVRASQSEDFPAPVEFEDEMELSEEATIEYQFAHLPAEAPATKTAKADIMMQGPLVGSKFTVKDPKSRPSSAAPRAGIRKPASKAVASAKAKKDKKSKQAAMKKLNNNKKASR